MAAARLANEAFLLSRQFERSLAIEDGRAAQQHLTAGRAIYYGDACYPDGLIKKYPDGRKQLVSVNHRGEISVLQDL
ncbi:MAG: hypothetical protein ACYCS1_10110 [Gammaproteobacteria bacterium]